MANRSLENEELTAYRTIFLSDAHLGCHYAQAESLLRFLNRVEPEELYIVGDFIDGWRLKRRWFWQTVYVQILQRLLHLAANGTQIYYAPGNHDEFLRDFLCHFGQITIADQFLHQTADGRRFVILHGDQFDDVERTAKWLSVIGAFAYDQLVLVNGIVNQFRRWFQLSDCRFSSNVKVWAKQAVQFISDFEQRVVCHAKELECDGVICGHIHVPRITSLNGITYCNTGDWVEHCTALVELESGELMLLDLSGQIPALSCRESRDHVEVLEEPQVQPVTQHAFADGFMLKDS